MPVKLAKPKQTTFFEFATFDGVKYITLPFQLVWRTIFFLNACVTFGILYPLFVLFLSKKKWYPLAFRLKKVWARLMLHPVGLFFTIERRGDYSNGPYVYAPNHTSYLDIILSYLIMPTYFHYMGKVELSKWFMFNIFFKDMNIPVERGHLRSSYKAYVRSVEDITNGISVGIFPEGLIPDDTPLLARFKNGPFKLAIEKQVPIVPITFINGWKLLPANDNRLNGGMPGVVKVILHEPIETKGMTEDDVSALRERVYHIINDTLIAEVKGYPEKYIKPDSRYHGAAKLSA